MDVRKWLTEISLEQYTELLEEKGVSVVDLWFASHSSLIKAGITSTDDRVKILKYRNRLTAEDRRGVAKSLCEEANAQPETVVGLKRAISYLESAIEIGEQCCSLSTSEQLSELSEYYFDYGYFCSELKGARSGIDAIIDSCALRDAACVLEPTDIQKSADLWLSCSTLATTTILKESERDHYRRKAFSVGESLRMSGIDDVSFYTTHLYICQELGDDSYHKQPADALAFYRSAINAAEQLSESGAGAADIEWVLPKLRRRIAALERDEHAVDQADEADNHDAEVDPAAMDFHRTEKQRSIIEDTYQEQGSTVSKVKGTAIQLLGFLIMSAASFRLSPITGFADWLFFFGGFLLLSNNNYFRRNLRKKRFRYQTHLIPLAAVSVSLYILLFAKLWVGQTPTTSVVLWLVTLLMLRRFSFNAAYVLKDLHDSFQEGALPKSMAPYALTALPVGAKPAVSPMFFFFAQRASKKRGRKFKGETESFRRSQMMGEGRVFPSISMIMEGSHALSQEEEYKEFFARAENRVEETDNESTLRVIGTSMWMMFAGMKWALRFFYGEMPVRKNTITFVDIHQIADYPADFQHYVIRHASAVVTVGEKLRSLAGQMLSTLVTADESERVQLLAETWHDRGPIDEKSTTLWNYLRVKEFPWAFNVTGPWYVLVASSKLIPDNLSGIRAVSVPEFRMLRSSAYHLIDLISQQAVPASGAVRKMSPAERNLSSAITKDGIPVVADAYLRFRMSESTVERFLNLFDCFEVLIKYSYIVECARGSCLPASKSEIPAALAKPTMGIWIRELTGILKSNHEGAAKAHFPSVVSSYWSGRLGAAPREFVNAAQGVGLAWAEPVPRSHLAWLNWLVWLRNQTKGHGGVAESVTLPIWQQFLSAFLEAIQGLQDLVFEAKILCPKSCESSLSGCMRGPIRISSQLPIERAGNQDPTWATFSYSGVDLSLAPYVILEGDACLTWNGMRGARAEYIDYATGKIVARDLPDSW